MRVMYDMFRLSGSDCFLNLLVYIFGRRWPRTWKKCWWLLLWVIYHLHLSVICVMQFLSFVFSVSSLSMSLMWDMFWLFGSDCFLHFFMYILRQRLPRTGMKCRRVLLRIVCNRHFTVISVCSFWVVFWFYYLSV